MIASQHKAFTLLEVLASVLVLGGTTVTILWYGADALALSMEIERRIASTVLAESEMEKVTGALRQSFVTDFAAWPNSLGNGYVAARTVTNVSQTLKVVQVSMGYDANGDGALGTNEIMATLTTQDVKRN